MVRIIGQEDKKPKEEKKPLSFSHQKVLHELLATISMCKMDIELKTILRMRVWGVKEDVFNPLTHKRIAQMLKCKESDVKRWEEDAVHNVKQFLDRTGIVAIKDKFIKDGGIKGLMNTEKRIIV